VLLEAAGFVPEEGLSGSAGVAAFLRNPGERWGKWSLSDLGRFTPNITHVYIRGFLCRDSDPGSSSLANSLTTPGLSNKNCTQTECVLGVVCSFSVGGVLSIPCRMPSVFSAIAPYCNLMCAGVDRKSSADLGAGVSCREVAGICLVTCARCSFLSAAYRLCCSTRDLHSGIEGSCIIIL